MSKALLWLAIILALLPRNSPLRAAESEPALARQAHVVLKANCHRCHGQEGAVEGGMNFILHSEKLVAARKVVPGDPDNSPLLKRIVAGKMPPAGESPRPSAAEVALLRKWIEAGAPSFAGPSAARNMVTQADVFRYILADLEKLERRSQRFVRYFTLTHLYNAGQTDDELATYRQALAKVLNSLSWHPRIALPQPIDPAKTILRIDLRELMWDANLWNRILAEYPYGISHDTAAAKIATVATLTRMPAVRADWFIATASRPPLYHDLLQLPTSLAELERQLRVDAAVNIQQERVARAGFNGSGVSRNNRLIERHDSIHGAYWRTYDFDAVPQNLVDRDNLLPDRRNLFAHPLGPGFTEASFQHAGGEAIFSLPNGLQGYMLVNALGQRVDRAPTAIVSDPRRPDRAVETGISCMSCHVTGINPKTDQIRAFVAAHERAFNRVDTEIIRALYVPENRMKALMEEDAERYRKAVEKTGSKVNKAEPVSATTLRYESDIDLPAAAAELGLPAAELLDGLQHARGLGRNLGSLTIPGGTVQRQVFVQAFVDLARELRLGTPFQPAAVKSFLPDNTGEIDPLEGQSSQANAVAFSSDGRWALLASADKSLRLWNVERNREVRRLVGHTASVWCVAFSADGKRAVSGGMDRTVRLWDVSAGRELRRLEGHIGLVSAVAFSADGHLAVSGGYDGQVIAWNLQTGEEERRLAGPFKYVHSLALMPDGHRLLVGADQSVGLWNLETGKLLNKLEGRHAAVVSIATTPGGKHAMAGNDDGSMWLWNLATDNTSSFADHPTSVRTLAISPDGKTALSGGADRALRVWDVTTGKALQTFNNFNDAVVGVGFLPGGSVVGCSGTGEFKVWELRVVKK